MVMRLYGYWFLVIGIVISVYPYNRQTVFFVRVIGIVISVQPPNRQTAKPKKDLDSLTHEPWKGAVFFQFSRCPHFLNGTSMIVSEYLLSVVIQRQLFMNCVAKLQKNMVLQMYNKPFLYIILTY